MNTTKSICLPIARNGANESASKRRVLIVYNEPVLPPGHPDFESEHEILDTVAAVEHNLASAGLSVHRLGVCKDAGVLVRGLKKHKPDVVFNLFEGTADEYENEAAVAAVLEWMGIPFTGSPARTLSLARDKALTKHILLGAGLPTANFFVADKLPISPCSISWPVIVKPASQDASVGIDQRSIVTSQEALAERVAWVLRSYGPPVLVEEFIPGRELNVAFIEDPELRPLPVSEILFKSEDPAFWPIVTYDAKWSPGSHDYEATPPRYPATVAPKLTERLLDLGRRTFRLLGCRDYARIDFRVKPTGKPYILEVNPNPDFSPSAGLSGGLVAAGLPHAQFTLRLVENAYSRGERLANGRT